MSAPASLSAPPTWILDFISPPLHAMAVEAIEAGNVGGFLCRANNLYGLDIVWRNQWELERRGLLEQAVVDAFTMTRTNNHHSYRTIRELVERCDRARLLVAGDRLPSAGPWTVYRGVAGNGAARRVRGYSWTADLERAQWFAERAGLQGLAAPAVYSTAINTSHVLFYSNGREEQEYVVSLPPRHPCRRMTPATPSATQGAV